MSSRKYKSSEMAGAQYRQPSPVMMINGRRALSPNLMRTPDSSQIQPVPRRYESSSSGLSATDQEWLEFQEFRQMKARMSLNERGMEAPRTVRKLYKEDNERNRDWRAFEEFQRFQAATRSYEDDDIKMQSTSSQVHSSQKRNRSASPDNFPTSIAADNIAHGSQPKAKKVKPELKSPKPKKESTTVLAEVSDISEPISGWTPPSRVAEEADVRETHKEKQRKYKLPMRDGSDDQFSGNEFIKFHSPTPAPRKAKEDIMLIDDSDDNGEGESDDNRSKRVLSRPTKLPSKLDSPSNTERRNKLNTIRKEDEPKVKVEPQTEDASQPSPDDNPDSGDAPEGSNSNTGAASGGVTYELLPAVLDGQAARLGSYKNLPRLRNTAEVPMDQKGTTTVSLDYWLKDQAMISKVNVGALIEFLKRIEGNRIVNPARSSPEKLCFVRHPFLGIGTAKNQKHPQHFITFGSAVSSNLVHTVTTQGKKRLLNKNVSIEPLTCEWERYIAFLGTVMREDQLAIKAFRGAIQISSSFDAPEDDGTGDSKYKRKTRIGKGSIDFAQRTLPATESVPVWDARGFFAKTFKKSDARLTFDNFESGLLPIYEGDISMNSLIAVIHTVGIADQKDQPCSYRAILNIKAVIVLVGGLD